MFDTQSINVVNQSNLVVSYYNNSYGWVDINDICSSNSPSSTINLISNLCYVGQYAIFYLSTGGNTELYPLQTTILSSVSSLLSTSTTNTLYF